MAALVRDVYVCKLQGESVPTLSPHFTHALRVSVSVRVHINIYSVSQKKTSPTFLAVTRESIVGFS